MGSIEVFNLITTQIHLQKLTRETAREMALMGDVGESFARYSAELKFISVANQYFPNEKPYLNIVVDSVNNNVFCSVSYQYKGFKYLKKDGIGVINLSAEATYPWFDRGI